MLSFLHLCCLWSMLHTHTRQLGIPLSLGLSVLFFLHCPFQIEIIFVNMVVAIASLLLISGVLFPFASTLAPRYSKLLTLSISSPSIAILASFLHLSMYFICLKSRPWQLVPVLGPVCQIAQLIAMDFKNHGSIRFAP